MPQPRRQPGTLRELSRLAASIDVEGRSGPEACLQLLRNVTQLQSLLLCGFDVDVRGLQISFTHPVGTLPSGTLELMGRLVTGKGPIGLFDPHKPFRAMRNRVICLEPLAEISKWDDRRLLEWMGRRGVPAAERSRHLAHLRDTLLPQVRRRALGDVHTARSLLCDNAGTLLAWFGALHEDPVPPAAQRLMQALVPVLVRRLEVEALMAEAPANARALDAAIEHIPAAALFVDEAGRVRHANSVGRRMLDADERGVRALIDRALKGTADPATATVTRFGPSGRYRMVILRGDAAPADGAVQAAAHRWELTPRQTQVLVLLARGHSNRDIAETLGCALHTVELHVSAILAKAGVENRSALVAALHRTGP